MSPDSRFKRIDFGETRRPAQTQPSPQEFLTRLSDGVAERFHRICGLTAVIIPVDLPGWPSDTPIESLPKHPNCAEFSSSERCREFTKAHLAELRLRPKVHWHKCPFERLCAFVPVAPKGRCLAACKLACNDRTPEVAFEHNIELLDVLTENFLIAESELLARLIPLSEGQDGVEGGLPITHREALARTSHPRVRQALEHIDPRVSDPDMTVAGVARALDINSTYLAHLFAQEVGLRMSRYIATRRIDLAKKLLTSTHWQIKRVAYESGHSNPDWFSQVFRAHTGMTPRDYRRKAGRP